MKLKNLLLSFLLQYPVYYVLVNGLAALTGIAIWWCVPIVVVIGLMYDIGEVVRRKETGGDFFG